MSFTYFKTMNACFAREATALEKNLFKKDK